MYTQWVELSYLNLDPTENPQLANTSWDTFLISWSV
jgi:hypothetical protein